jgi:hypothetical protein
MIDGKTRAVTQTPASPGSDTSAQSGELAVAVARATDKARSEGKAILEHRPFVQLVMSRVSRYAFPWRASAARRRSILRSVWSQAHSINLVVASMFVADSIRCVRAPI